MEVDPREYTRSLRGRHCAIQRSAAAKRAKNPAPRSQPMDFDGFAFVLDLTAERQDLAHEILGAISRLRNMLKA